MASLAFHFANEHQREQEPKSLLALIITRSLLHKIPKMDQLVGKYDNASSVLLLVCKLPSEAFFMMKTEISHRFANNAADAPALLAPPAMAGRYVSVVGEAERRFISVTGSRCHRSVEARDSKRPKTARCGAAGR